MDAYRFTCLPGCSKCCDSEGFVYLTEGDLKRAAAHLGMSATAFERKYVYRTRHLRRLRKPKDQRQCPFHGERGCDIHPAKPTQCRAFPFWPELLENRELWRATARLCPGIGSGPLVTIQTALRIAGEMREAHPAMYE